MKPYAVIKYKADVDEFVFRNPANRRDALAFSQPQQATNPHQERLEEERDVYFTDTEESAKSLCDTLATKYTAYSWLIAKTQSVSYREPGPVRVATFTDAGLMPA